MRSLRIQTITKVCGDAIEVIGYTEYAYTALPSQVHPSYPYGDPTNVNHPASQPRNDGDPASRMLFVDSMYTGAVTGVLLWDELALDHLLPVDKGKADVENATLARAAVGNIQAQNPREDVSDDGDENQG